MAGIGFSPVGSAHLQDNYDGFVLGKAARAVVAGIEDDDAAALARDLFTNQSFRRDVFGRDLEPLDAATRRRRLIETPLALTGPAEALAYDMETPAGRVAFNTAAARAVVAGLAAGPRRIAELDGAGAATDDLLANALTLCASGALRPVEGGAVPVARLNRAIADRLASDAPIELLALSCGMAIAVDRALIATLGRAGTPDQAAFPGWARFLAAYGA
jgi:hypothetical protein